MNSTERQNLIFNQIKDFVIYITEATQKGKLEWLKMVTISFRKELFVEPPVGEIEGAYSANLDGGRMHVIKSFVQENTPGLSKSIYYNLYLLDQNDKILHNMIPKNHRSNISIFIRELYNVATSKTDDRLAFMERVLKDRPLG